MFVIELYQVNAYNAYWNVPAKMWMTHPDKGTEFNTREEAEAEMVNAKQSGVKGIIEVKESFYDGLGKREPVRILTLPEAMHVYGAMCHLNEIGGILHVRIIQGAEIVKHVEEYLTDEVDVYVRNATSYVGGREVYVNQDAFAKAYGLK